jgi:hypothetical protein
VHPFAVPVTVYVVVFAGEASTTLPVVVFNPVDGDQEYVFAPLAVMVTVPPTQIAEGFEIIICGTGVTLIAMLLVAVQPLMLSVAVTLYVVFAEGVATGLLSDEVKPEGDDVQEKEFVF